MKYNGTFKYTLPTEVERDASTGFISAAGSSGYLPGCECQIDKSIPAKTVIGTDGQARAYTYDVFIPKYFKCDELTVGCMVQVNYDGGGSDEFEVLGIDDANRKYIEIWG